MYQFNVDLNLYPELLDINKKKLHSKINTILKTGYELLYPKIENINDENKLILSKLDNIERNTPSILELNKSITQLIGISSNSSKKGELVESMIEEYVIKKYSSNKYQVKRSEPHCGDGWLLLPNNQTAIVEVKSYSKTVSNVEVEKLKYDMKYNDINLGIMVSLGTGIQNSNLIDLEMFSYNNKNFYIIKIGPLINEINILDLGFNLLEKVSNICQDNNKMIILEDNLLNKTKLLLEKINKNIKLREKYQNMTMEIYQKMDSFNQEMTLLFLEQEQLLKQIITEINDNSIYHLKITSSNIEELEKFNNYKIYNQLLKVMDLLKNKKIIFEINKDKIKSNKFELKITQEKLNIKLTNMNLSILLTSKNSDIKSNKMNFELLDKLL